MSNVTNKIATKVEGRDLVMERIFDAPRELVFKVFSESQHLARWWGPKGWKTENHAFDFKPNGVWHYCMRCMDERQKDFYGQESWGKAVYQEIIAPEKIVYVDTFSDPEGNSVESMPEMLITMTFVEHDDKTKIITRTQFATVEALQSIIDMGVVQGTESQYERLDEYLKDIQ